jgi:hypothetical protein
MNRRKFLNQFLLLPIAAPAAIAAAAKEIHSLQPAGGFQTVKALQALFKAYPPAPLDKEAA